MQISGFLGWMEMGHEETLWGNRDVLYLDHKEHLNRDVLYLAWICLSYFTKYYTSDKYILLYVN